MPAQSRRLYGCGQRESRGVVKGQDAAVFRCYDTAMSNDPAEPFWRTVPMEEMTSEQWESLCDGCGRCCLNKLIYEDTNEIGWTDVACHMLDGQSCRCSDYPNRRQHVPDCVSLTVELLPTLDWLPPTCAYRLVYTGEELYWWHPLVSGNPETVHAAGVSVRGRTVSEKDVPMDDWDDYVVEWPGEGPPLMTEAQIRKAMRARQT